MKRKHLFEKETHFENETNLRKVNTCEEETSILKRKHLFEKETHFEKETPF